MASESPGEWTTEIRDLAGFPVKIEQRGGEVIVIVAKTAPRGRIRLGENERNDFIRAYAEAERRAEAWEAAQVAGPEGEEDCGCGLGAGRCRAAEDGDFGG